MAAMDEETEEQLIEFMKKLEGLIKDGTYPLIEECYKWIDFLQGLIPIYVTQEEVDQILKESKPE